MTQSTSLSKHSGILQRAPGGGRLRQPEVSFQPQPGDLFVSAAVIKQFHLVEGASVVGTARHTKQGEELAIVLSINGLAPEAFRKRALFAQLTAVKPHERFNLATSGLPAMRIIDLIAPIGKGTRGLIVSPPKSGKTILLEQIARSVQVDDPSSRIILLLIDERPEEVTHFRRMFAKFEQAEGQPPVNAAVFASSNDQTTQEHIALTELMMAHIRVELECGRNVVVLVDSLTRMTRAYNLHGTGSRKTLSGGVDAGAMETPRRFLGLARKVENGGSITVLATALIDTNSRMDDLVYQEFKGTGNSEIVLNRELAEARIYPAINLLSSSTRNDELFYNESQMAKLAKLRRWLAGGSPKSAMNGLLKLIEKTTTNEELLQRLKV